jgi:chitin disaccharide deacetylase
VMTLNQPTRAVADNSLVMDEVDSGAAVVVNADDWGRDTVTTRRTFECLLCGAISSVSAMVFMEDSAQAAQLARQHEIDAGLHLNFTTPFSAPGCPLRLREHQQTLSRFLLSHRWAPAVYHPLLRASFDYVVKAQFEEYERLYGFAPNRVDGHHHMHLCANVLMQKLIPSGLIVRRNLVFAAGEKSYLNRFYRRQQDKQLARRYRLAHFFFDLQPLEPRQRLKRIFALSERFDVEVETHPARDAEYRFLANREWTMLAGEGALARGYSLRFQDGGNGVRGVR